MPKKKQSLFEKITGIQKIEEEEQSISLNSNPQQGAPYSSQSYNPGQTQEDSYEFPEQNQQPASYRGQSDFSAISNKTPEQQQPAPQQQQSTPIASSQDDDSEGQLTIDVFQTEDDIYVKSTIAGVKAEDLDVNINNDMVTIRGERTQDEVVDPENYYYQECYWGPFSRSVILPVEVLSDKTEASLKNGILTLRLPKADTTKIKKIQVRGY